MASSRGSATRTCPACGARNSDLSLFCAECGAPLNNGAWNNDAEQTQAFEPATAPSRRDTTPPEDPAPPVDADRNGYRSETTGEIPYAGPPAATYGNIHPLTTGDEMPDATHVIGWESSGPRGARGFVLGIVAWLIIIGVFVLFLWVYVFDSTFRADVRGLVGLGAIAFDLR